MNVYRMITFLGIGLMGTALAFYGMKKELIPKISFWGVGVEFAEKGKTKENHKAGTDGPELWLNVEEDPTS